MFPASVLLVADHRIFREALRALLNHETDLRVVAEADDGAEAQRMAAALKPVLAVVDMMLPDGLGSAAVQQILAVSPATAALVLSDSPDADEVADAFAAGSMGFALKTQRGAEIVAALRRIRGGHRYVAPGVVAPELAAYVRLAMRNGLLDG